MLVNVKFVLQGRVKKSFRALFLIPLCCCIFCHLEKRTLVTRLQTLYNTARFLQVYVTVEKTGEQRYTFCCMQRG